MSRFSITLSPRISETDLVGHMNNVSIAAWFEDLRVRYMATLGEGEEQGGIDHFTLASLTIDFIGETHYGTDVTLTMQSVTVGNSSITLEGELDQGNGVLVKGRAVMVHWDPDTHRPRRIPEAYRQQVASAYPLGTDEGALRV